MRLRRSLQAALTAVLVVLLSWGALRAARGPSNERDWAPDHERLAAIAFEGDSMVVTDLRDFDHGPDGTATPRYRTEAFPLDSLERVWFALAPFADRYRGLAHTFVSFEFAHERFLAVSVEARRERDESYGIVGGMLRAFEVIYVVGTERDLIGQRARRGDELYLYPSVATPEQSRAILVDMLTRADGLRADPEMYHTLLNNCTTKIRDHVNRVTAADLPWGWGILLPGFSDELALDEGLLATDLPIDEARRAFRADERARAELEGGGGEESFGARIRSVPTSPATAP